ncbi:Rieske 2Fe-2S domain-containing protein [Gemmatimonas sp.]|uniref:Rieske 2Fe-2S domain-containing protein n=1 Tax=Gemmatimonas sp. TaxID=1962908 RepID=UPI00286D5ECC|nr:Rieske 2Fe-2S domain-containing protein [Gemmatimonas sp.]
MPLDPSSELSPALSSDRSLCGGCHRVDRRQFLASASVLSLGVLVSGCGDGIISGPEQVLDAIPTPFRFDPATIPELAQIGGRTVVVSGTAAPVMVERLASAQFRALSLVCPHRGSIVNVEPNGLRCPNHGAVFANDGTWLGGQPTAGLAALDVRRNSDGSLLIGGTLTPPVLGLERNAVVFLTTLSGSVPAPQTVAISNDGGGILGGLAVTLTYGPGQRTGWLSLALSQASAPSTLTLSAQRGTLPIGNYTATVNIAGTGITNGAQTVSVSLLVQDPTTPAALQISTSALSFTAPLGSTPAAQVVQCNNSGGGTLTGLVATVSYGAGGTGWITTILNQTTAPATLTVRPSAGALAAGSYSATVTVSANGVASRTIAVTLSVTAAGLVVTLAAWPALANVGGVAGSVGNVNGGPVAVSRLSATSFAAFSMRCPHAGTTINVVNGTSFRCPNHGALFNSAGVWQPSPQRADNLSTLTVIYTPGAATLTVT